MMSTTRNERIFFLVAVSACTALPSEAAAQSDDSGLQAPAGGVTVVQVPASAAPAPPSYSSPLPPPSFDPNGHLPSSSRASANTSRSSDGFDLKSGAGGPVSVRGAATGQYITEGSFTPGEHAVRRGDTLWEIAARYYQNPYQWPRLWSYNTQIQNPHWIYPGDRVHLHEPGVAASASMVGLGTRKVVPSQTIFLREVGWIDDKNDDTWGEIVGSPLDRMMLGQTDDIYIQIGNDHDVSLGDELTLFRPIRTVEREDVKGELVSIRGTARVERYNAKTKMVRAKVVEAIDVIERGIKVGPVGRKFDMVPPVKSDVDLEAAILASVYPGAFFGQHQVVFIDRGEKDGVKPGMRFFAIARGDRWQQSIPNAGKLARLRPRVEDDRPGQVDRHAIDTAEEDKLPDETYAELRVMRVREHTATVLVYHTKHEIERNARLVARKGY